MRIRVNEPKQVIERYKDIRESNIANMWHMAGGVQCERCGCINTMQIISAHYTEDYGGTTFHQLAACTCGALKYGSWRINVRD